MHLYIHIPFCASRCVYCDFYVVLAKYGGQEAFVAALLKEIDLRWQGLEGQLPPITTLYLGGGTPSLLPASAYAQLKAKLLQYTTLAPHVEWTMEANPLYVADAPEAYRAVGINRWSLGVQSFNAKELKALSRSHTAEQALAWVHTLQASGLGHLSLDLMYGIPHQNLASWEATLHTALSLGLPHYSLYGLQVEEGTPLALLRQKAPHAYPLSDDDEVLATYYATAIEAFATHGLHPYERSNVAKPGWESRHNLAYWRNANYWAFGPSAHGYVHPYRYAVASDLKAYLAHPLAGTLLTHVSPQQRLENAFIFGLRQQQGVHLPTVQAQTEPALWQRMATVWQQQVAWGHLEHHTATGYLRLNPALGGVMNSVLSAFLLDEDPLAAVR